MATEDSSLSTNVGGAAAVYLEKCSHRTCPSPSFSDICQSASGADAPAVVLSDIPLIKESVLQ